MIALCHQMAALCGVNIYVRRKLKSWGNNMNSTDHESVSYSLTTNKASKSSVYVILQ